MPILLLNSPFVTVGLGTFTYRVPTAGVYNITVQSTQEVPSGLSIVINQNGSPVYTAPTLSPTQSALQFKFDLLCAAADALTVVLSSSAAQDQLYNSLQTTLAIGNGF